jgi:hypothetical protein
LSSFVWGVIAGAFAGGVLGMALTSVIAVVMTIGLREQCEAYREMADDWMQDALKLRDRLAWEQRIPRRAER